MDHSIRYIDILISYTVVLHHDPRTGFFTQKFTDETLNGERQKPTNDWGWFVETDSWGWLIWLNMVNMVHRC